tara:strand:- start:120 stop:392 length:273 start_codon:yes stop_codon:yes gene_type:complete
MFEPKVFEVWPEHEEVLTMYLRCSTQWRSGPSGVIGLDYGVVIQLCNIYHIKDIRALLDDLQVMENRTLELIAEQQEKAEKEAQRKAKRK